MNRTAAALVGLILFAPAALRAQGSERLTITGGPITFTAPTVTDFSNGFLPANGALTYSIAGRGAGTGVSHTTTISVRATGTTLGGTKPIGDLQWRRADLGTWNSMTNTNVQIEQRTLVRRGTNDPWTNQIFFQMLLSFANDAPGAHSATLRFTLTVTTP